MKVYVISEVVMYEGERIQAIFLNEEKAKEEMAKWEKRIPVAEKTVWYDLTEYDVEE